MIKLDTSKVRYYSQLDEAHFFRWAKKIHCVTSIEGGYFHISAKTIPERDLRDLIAIMYRYKMPMRQLRQFLTTSNKTWFKDKRKYWFRRVFGHA